MTGAKGKSGGSRDGAGRPAQNLTIGRGFKIRVGDKVLVRSEYQDGSTLDKLAVVSLRGNSRSRIIRLACDDGETIVISLYS
jgi:hypothetical protein